MINNCKAREMDYSNESQNYRLDAGNMVNRILIVDDEETNQMLMKAILKKLDNVEVVEAANGVEALKEISVRDIDLVILDLMMPLKNGFEVLSEMKRNEKYSLIPVIVNSAVNGLDQINQALSLGAYDFFTKPLTSEQICVILPKKVKNALNNHQLYKQQIRLVKELYEKMEKIQYLSYHDTLTGLYNRAYLEEALQRNNQDRLLPLSIIMGDVNGLKIVNDTFGHQMGDQMLQMIAAILRESCRDEDIIARWGGDEFTILLPGATNAVALEICNNIRIRCMHKEENGIYPSISLGVSTRKLPDQDISQLLREAEEGMYQNKLLENNSIRSSIVNSLKKVLFEKSFETEEHAERMSELALKIGSEMGMGKSEIGLLNTLCILHDIGKIAIPDTILQKPGKLDPDEWKIMQMHSEIGFRIASSSVDLTHVAQLILYHHERWDGSGYPFGLRKEQIPILDRILAIADAYDVITHKRVYKEALSRNDAVDEIIRCSGTYFDPAIVEIFVRMSLD